MTKETSQNDLKIIATSSSQLCCTARLCCCQC